MDKVAAGVLYLEQTPLKKVSPTEYGTGTAIIMETWNGLELDVSR